MKIYVASSWRNNVQVAVVHALRASGHEVYDFKNPPNNTGFRWTEVAMDSYNSETQLVDIDDYIQGIQHPRAVEGFASDFDAMEWADACVLVLPCGRSAHLELGWFVGQGKRTAILLDGPTVTPELMYRMVDYISLSMFDLLGWVGVQPEIPLQGVKP